LKKKGGPLCINSSKKILKISIINPTYPYVYECIVKIVYYSSEDGNKKFNHHHQYAKISANANCLIFIVYAVVQRGFNRIKQPNEDDR
jgi:hypothetical protein